MKPAELRFLDPDVPAIVLWEERILLGRDESCDRILPGEKVSKRHAELRREGLDWWLADLGSTNGSTVDGVSCETPQHLTDGARVKIGGLHAIFHAAGGAPAPAAIPAAEPEPIEVWPPRLVFDDSERRPLILERSPIVVGRDAGCDHTLVHEKVSKRHAELYAEGNEWSLRDLGSTNGTTVDGTSCEIPQTLRAGARIKFGGVFATFEPGATSALAAPAPGATRAGGGGAVRRPRREAARRRAAPLQLVTGLAVVAVCVAAGLMAIRAFDERRELASAGSRGSIAPPDSQRGAGTGAPRTIGPAVVDPSAGSRPLPPDPDSRAGPGAKDLSDIHPLFRGRFDRENVRDIERQLEAERRRIRRLVDDREDDPGTRREPVTEPTEPIATVPPTPIPEAERVSPATPRRDPVARALERRDAGALARALLAAPDSSGAAEARRLLESASIPCLHSIGSLTAVGDDELRRVLPLHCVAADLETLGQLPFPVTVHHRLLQIRHRSDYATGLGPRVGKVRLAPHPRSVTIAIHAGATPAEAGERLARIEGATPRVPADEFDDGGVSEAEVWRRTLEPLAAPLAKALGTR